MEVIPLQVGSLKTRTSYLQKL